MNKIPMTQIGAKQLTDELQQLKTVERPAVIKAIAEARAHGDLKENAEYHAAKERQGFIEGRIAKIESDLSFAHIVDPKTLPDTGKVVFGVTVKLVHLDNDQEVTYQIVGEDEADIKLSKVSVNSPIARAMIGKMKGDVINVQTPNGLVEYEIIAVSF